MKNLTMLMLALNVFLVAGTLKKNHARGIVYSLPSYEDITNTEAGKRCWLGFFGCDFNDPCKGGLCEEGQVYYPGSWFNRYVKCQGTDNAFCTENTCPEHTFWNQDHKRCENIKGVEARCSYGVFDCELRNPCSPSLCIDGVTSYPGHAAADYITCQGACQTCTMNSCPEGEEYDAEEQICVEKKDKPWWWPLQQEDEE